MTPVKRIDHAGPSQPSPDPRDGAVRYWGPGPGLPEGCSDPPGRTGWAAILVATEERSPGLHPRCGPLPLAARCHDGSRCGSTWLSDRGGWVSQGQRKTRGLLALSHAGSHGGRGPGMAGQPARMRRSAGHDRVLRHWRFRPADGRRSRVLGVERQLRPGPQERSGRPAGRLPDRGHLRRQGSILARRRSGAAGRWTRRGSSTPDARSCTSLGASRAKLLTSTTMSLARATRVYRARRSSCFVQDWHK